MKQGEIRENGRGKGAVEERAGGRREEARRQAAGRGGMKRGVEPTAVCCLGEVKRPVRDGWERRRQASDREASDRAPTAVCITAAELETSPRELAS